MEKKFFEKRCTVSTSSLICADANEFIGDTYERANHLPFLPLTCASRMCERVRASTGTGCADLSVSALLGREQNSTTGIDTCPSRRVIRSLSVCQKETVSSAFCHLSTSRGAREREREREVWRLDARFCVSPAKRVRPRACARPRRRSRQRPPGSRRAARRRPPPASTPTPAQRARATGRGGPRRHRYLEVVVVANHHDNNNTNNNERERVCVCSL